MTGVGTYWRTVRHLKAGQILGRVAHRLHRPRPDLRPAPDRRERSGAWAAPARREASLEAPATFILLGERHALDRIGWDDPAVERLWRYNQHYFDDLNALDAAEREPLHVALIERWIAENPPGRGTGWEPYPTSLRIVNWIKWLLCGHPAPARMEDSLAVQARWLAQRLETHLLGNHLFANAKALVHVGLYFQGAEAARWQRTGAQLLERELPEQILADGGHFERSPMYHALALEDVLDLLNAIDALGAGESAVQSLRRELAARIPSMRLWLAAMTRPDGTLARFNDCADGIAPPLAELTRLASALGCESAMPRDDRVLVLPESGYVRLHRGAVVALLDVAPVGPDYLPGHAHADTLSFELSLGARQVVVNVGTSRYGTGARRRYERSTAAHSTVELDGLDSSEVWSGFRVGRRARPGRPRVEPLADGCEVSCDHDGYTHLPGHPVHARKWRLDAAGLTVRDEISGPARPALARFHLAPGVAPTPIGAGAWALTDAAGPVARVDVELGSARIEASTYAPRFGEIVATQCLTVALDRGTALTRWTFAR